MSEESEPKTMLGRWGEAISKAFHAPSRLGFQEPGSDQLPAAQLAASSMNFTLAPLGDDDAAALRAVTDNPQITERISFLKSPFSIQDAQDLIRANLIGYDSFLGIRRRADHALVGVVGVHRRGEGQVEIGYWIGVSYQNQGYATEALAALVARLKDIMPDRQIIAECKIDNEGSVKLLQKLGFQNTGTTGARPGRVIFALR